MDSAYMPVISAGIGGLVALIVVFINQIMEHLRWKENLIRKGEDKYLDKKIEILHDSNVELFQLANEALRLSRIPKQQGKDKVHEEFKTLDSKVRERIAKVSPYLENNFQKGLDNLYDLLTNVRLILNNEIEGSAKEVTTNLLWLNEEIWHFRDELIIAMKGFQKGYNRNKLFQSFILLSIVLNIIFVGYIFFIT